MISKTEAKAKVNAARGEKKLDGLKKLKRAIDFFSADCESRQEDFFKYDLKSYEEYLFIESMGYVIRPKQTESSFNKRERKDYTIYIRF